MKKDNAIFKEKNRPPVVVMNFTHVYEEEDFYQKEPYQWVDCTDMNGVYGYCDSEAGKQIKSRLSQFKAHGIHFIDSGNFHYVSKFWMEKVKQKFVLILFDHHTDMMESRFGGLLSCGSWARDALEHNPYLQKIVLIGADASLVTNVEDQYKNRIEYYSTTYFEQPDHWIEFANKHSQYPIYISVDKDVLNPIEEPTDWDQGTMSLKMLENILHILIQNHELLGVDITGESTNLLEAGSDAIQKNDSVNHSLLHLLMERDMM